MAQLSESVRDFEPKIALTAGKTGYEFYEKMIPIAYQSLKKDGFIILEMGKDQHKKITQLLKINNFKNIEIFKDLNKIYRVITGKK